MPLGGKHVMGFDLQDSTRAQSLLEDALANDSSLLAAEVFDAAGIDSQRRPEELDVHEWGALATAWRAAT